MSRGHVFKKGPTWKIKYDGPPDPATGARRQKWEGGFPTRKAAQAALNDALARISRGGYVEPSQQTVREFAADWHATIAPTVKATTLEQYGRYLRLHIVPNIGGVRLAQVTAADLNRMYAGLLASGLSARTVRLVHAVVHRMFRDAAKWDLIGRNPAEAADPPRQPGGKTHKLTTWTASQLRDFLADCDQAHDPWRSLWTFLATTGVRRAEAIGLRWADVDLDRAVCRVVQQVVLVGGEVILDTPKTQASARPVTLDGRTVAALRQHRKEQNEHRLLMGAGWRDHDLVWCRETGEPLRPKRVNELLNGSIRRAGAAHISPHGLRHTWATLALEQGVHPKVVQERLGHTRIGTTMDIYTHSTPVMHRQAADDVAAAIFGPE